jgi:RNA polymerase sigma factor (sigma-70 family)
MPKPPSEVDAAVLVRAQRGDRAAHARLYETFAGMVFTLARRIVASNALAEDVLQETFVEVLRKIGTYRGEAEFRFWVKRIAINKCLSYLRSSRERRRTDDGDAALAFVHARETVLDEQVALARALDALPDVARAVVWLHDVEGYTHKEIGRMMGYTTSFSKSQLARAHERLRSLLRGEPDESEAALCGPVLKIC